MPIEVEYVMRKNGSFRRDINERPIRVDDALDNEFSAGVCRKCPSVALIGGDYGMAAVAMLDNYEFWSVRVLNLGLNAPFYLEEGIHTPAFATKNAVLPMSWKPIMPVIMGITIHRKISIMTMGDHYLIAIDTRGNHWRLPVSNVSDVGKLCHGQDARNFSTSLDCVRYACERFSKSTWNSDWYNADVMPHTKAMFRFKPNEGGFQQLPPVIADGKDWTSLCSKIAVDNLNKLVQNV